MLWRMFSSYFNVTNKNGPAIDQIMDTWTRQGLVPNGVYTQLRTQLVGEELVREFWGLGGKD